MDVKSSWPLWAGLHTCYNGDNNGMQWCESEQILKNHLSSDCSLQLENIKLESLVIVDQHATVNTLTGLVHTARQVLEISWTLNRLIQNKDIKLVPVPACSSCWFYRNDFLFLFLYLFITVLLITGIKS
jgi:hypothetical protein